MVRPCSLICSPSEHDSLVGQEHGRTIPLAAVELSAEAKVKSDGRNEAVALNVCRNAGYGVAVAP